MPSSAVPSSTGCARQARPKPALAKAGGDKALVGNSGFRRYLKTVSAKHFAVDETRVAEDARFDGLYVLRTNTKLTPLQVQSPSKRASSATRASSTAKCSAETVLR